VRSGWTLAASGVEKRYVSDGEPSSQMAAQAVQRALDQAGLDLSEIDALVSVSGTMQQPIPSTGALIAAELGVKDGLLAFDVNATCLGFLVGLDLVAGQIALGRYERVVLVAAEVASVGLNWKQKESAALFGDGAVAVVIGKGVEGSSHLRASHFETYPEGAEYCRIQGGGTKLHAQLHSADRHEAYLFDMNGPKLFKLVARKLPRFIDQLLDKAGMALDDIDLVIPHQASQSGLQIMRRRLGIPSEKYFVNVQNQGNVIAASIPLALHDAYAQGRIKRGDKVMLLGSSAGVSLGGLILDV
jgi:3-oxoacyl-[acyl-carrier-protein] synthase-3